MLFPRPLPILGMGMVVLGSVLLLLHLTVRHKVKDPLFYGTNTHTDIYRWSVEHVAELFFIVHLCVCSVFAEFSFTCMVGLTNAFEQDGFISGFMGFYLKMVRWAKHEQSKECFNFTCLNVKSLNLHCMMLFLQGEPHLSTAYAVMMSYWEGVVHVVLFLTMIHRMFKG